MELLKDVALPDLLLLPSAQPVSYHSVLALYLFSLFYISYKFQAKVTYTFYKNFYSMSKINPLCGLSVKVWCIHSGNLKYEVVFVTYLCY